MAAPHAPRAETSRLALAFGLYLFLGGLMSFLGWVRDVPRLTDWVGSNVSIQPNAALAAAAAGLAFVLLSLGRRAMAGALGGLTALIGLATLYEHVTGDGLGFDALLLFGRAWGQEGTVAPGRMGPPGSVSWSISGIALVLVASGHSRVRRFVPALAAVICAIATLSLIGYLYNSDVLHTLPRLTVIAFQTATFVLAAGLGLMASVPEHGLAAMLRREDAAGMMARRIVIPMLIVPILLGWLRLVGERVGWYDPSFGTAARTLSEIVLLSILLWWAGHAIANAEDSRRRDRLALDVRDRLLGAVTEHAAVGLAIVDPARRYLYANRQYATILGLPKTALVGRRVDEMLEGVYESEIEPRLASALQGSRVHFELVLPARSPDGRDRLFDVIYEPQRRGLDVESVVVAITDITERRGAESSLREQAHLLDLANDAIMVLEMDGTIVSWNRGAVETYGFARDESVGHNARDLLHTVFPQPLPDILESAERHGGWEGELTHITKDGRRIVVASRWAVQPASGGRPARVMEINRDVTNRKRMEAAIKAKESELLLVTSTTPVLLTRCSRDLRYLFVNQAAATMFGRAPHQIVGHPMREVMGEEAFARIRPSVERVLSGEEVEIELEIPYPTTGPRWMRAHSMPERDEQGTVVGWIASLTDITERKRVEDKLRESERTERLLADIGALATRAGVADVSIDDIVRTICRHVSEEMAASRCGFGRVDVDAATVSIDAEWRGDLPALEGSYDFRDYAAHLLEDGQAGRVTVLADHAADPRTAERYDRLYRPMGIRSSINVPLRRNGRWVAHFWVSSEQPRAWTDGEVERMRRTAERLWLVIEQTRVAANLRESEARLARELSATRQLQEVGTQLIQGDELPIQLERILAASAAITGTRKGHIALADAPGGTLRLVVQQGLGPRLLERIAMHGVGAICQGALGSGERVIVEDVAREPLLRDSWALEALLEDGVRAIQCTPIVGRDGRVLGVLSDHFPVVRRPSESELRYLDLLARMAADLIERKQVEEALREADRRKDEFLATLAHELRNPLAPIRNAIHLLRLRSEEDADAKTAHEIIDRQIQHMVRLVDDLLEVSRITSGRIELKKKRVDLSTLVAQAVETVHGLIDESHQQLSVSLPSEPVALDVDPVRITQVLANLLNNACKYTPPGGRIEVTARAEGRAVVVRVKDSGAGIPLRMLDKVFGLFTQVDRTLERTTGGLGIGLHLVRRLVEMHGGTVSASSAGENQGSEFVIRLPAAVVPRPSEAPAEFDGARPTTSKKILVVDDNVDSVESLALLLRHQGHRTEMAHDGQEAVDKAESWRPDVILLDIGLPIMNGYDACRAIRRMPFARDVQIVALSGWGQEQDRAKARDAGFDEHLVKPVDIARLLKLIDEPAPAET